jgi:predicted O-linked N-acetylglucosamine transferase (SPINDLY family)
MDPRTIQQTFDQAVRHHQAGQLPEAEQLYREVLAQNPEHALAMHNLGVIAHQTGRNELAVELIARAVAIKPNYAEAHCNLGDALRVLGRFDDAVAACRQAIALRPNFAEAHFNLANALHGKGELDEAIAAFRSALAINPNIPEVHYNLGVALRDQGRSNQAAAAYRQAIALKPDYVDALINLGTALRDQGLLDEAVAAYRQGIHLRPDHIEAHNNLGIALKDQGRLDESIAEFRQAVALEPSYAEAHSNLIFTMHYHPGFDAVTIAEEQRRWNLQHAEPLRKTIRPHSNDRDPDRPLRIGYVSPDFRDHVVGRCLVPIFQNHNREKFEIIAYSGSPHGDTITQMLQRNAKNWRNIAGLPDDQAAEQIRQDQIDILVDLTMHTPPTRLLVFARKPAPVQVTWLGYPGSTGLTAIDYRLSDPYLDPPGMDESFYSEQTIRLPETFLCYDPLEHRQISVNSLPALERGFITFGCLNNFCKVNDELLALWAKVMQQVHNSRLLLLAPQGSPRERTSALFSQNGIDPGRIEFVSHQSHQKYLEEYHRIDVGLNTFPFNGGITTCDALWMGVPVVTLVGQAAVARAGWSQLSNLGLPELAADTAERFVRITVELARDLPRLGELRSKLRPRMQQSPLMDAPRFARNLEAAYRRMWQLWCAK